MNIPQMCPRFEKAMELLSKRWTVLIVFQLTNGPQRFVAIENSIPNLSGKVLSDRLKELEEEGIIQRTVYPEKPVRIEYSLTDKGRDLAPLFDHIGTWATRWIEVLPVLEQQ
ncbi:winged helix-turn-helix transcriptional regulator [Paenibacillus polymyxa]|uniref:winged helix-turn-helix transcriptional regulator n=1 Tax=Paenibacillus TaxID=44249 RepID=UPI0020254A82|nr:helix-turn-helix domain-containing protein [Paenibacillus polymyxa]MDY7993988.1 helix-turn-helix domain-containing protein [Paenibacillus polymyxa]MDY8047807.1 helix-turn-helix domain-containing protein [Paenibacillus polymyxa]MDY8119125.1 helix-turn-helix domain-containing protein [Paenibacillus polymyxa]URJ38956.1 helix-turn-helix domain-containing protein [Paenibacillus polymyxa]